MPDLRRLVLVRHGETVGDSSVRFHGNGDPELSEEGRAHMRQVAVALRREPVELVVASPLRRSWRAAWIVGEGQPVRIESGFREVHFGRWEGLTREEIQAQDPTLYEEWQRGAEDFQYPNGEARAEFKARVEEAVDRLLAVPKHSALLVVHKGVIRVIVEKLTGETLPVEEPALGGIVILTRRPDGSWYLGKTSSNPPGLDEAA